MFANGPVVFFLNSAIAGPPAVTNHSPLILPGATSGSVDVSVTLTDAQELVLLAGDYYLNIHSVTHPPGELRANLVVAPTPTPSAFALLVIGMLALALRGPWKAT